MSAQHKGALVNGREQSRLIRSYLDALEGLKPKKGRPRTRESVEKQLLGVNEQLGLMEDPLERVNLVAQRQRLESELASLGVVDLVELTAGFVRVARDYSARHEITRSAWREVGVPPDVLNEAGIR